MAQAQELRAVLASMPTKDTPEKMSTDDAKWRSMMQGVDKLAQAYASNPKALEGIVPVQSKGEYDGLNGKESFTFICDKSIRGHRKVGAMGIIFGSRGSLTAIDTGSGYSHVYTVRNRPRDKMRAYRFQRVIDKSDNKSSSTVSVKNFTAKEKIHIVHVVNDNGGKAQAAIDGVVNAAVHASDVALLLQSDMDAPVVENMDAILDGHTDELFAQVIPTGMA